MAKLTAPIGTPREVWETIDLGPDGEFQVCVRSPSGEESLHDQSLVAAGWQSDPERTTSAYIEHRLRPAIFGWKDLTSESGSDIAFSWDALMGLCTAYPVAFRQLLSLADQAYSGRMFDRKNSE